MNQKRYYLRFLVGTFAIFLGFAILVLTDYASSLVQTNEVSEENNKKEQKSKTKTEKISKKSKFRGLKLINNQVKLNIIILKNYKKLLYKTEKSPVLVTLEPVIKLLREKYPDFEKGYLKVAIILGFFNQEKEALKLLSHFKGEKSKLFDFVLKLVKKKGEVTTFPEKEFKEKIKDRWIYLLAKMMYEKQIHGSSYAINVLNNQLREYEDNLFMKVSLLGLLILIFFVSGVVLTFLFPKIYKKWVRYSLKFTFFTPPFVSIKTALKILILWGLSYLFIATAVHTAFTLLNLKTDTMIYTAINYVLMMSAGVFLVFHYYLKEDRWNTFLSMVLPPYGTFSYSLLWSLIGYGVSFFGIFLIVILFYSIIPVTGNPQDSYVKLLGLVHNNWEKVLFFVNVAILAPLFEEFFFRGFLYNAIKFKTGKNLAMVLQAVIFAFFHFNTINYFPLVFLGVMLAFLYETTGSLFSSMLLHGLWNLISAYILFTVFG